MNAVTVAGATADELRDLRAFLAGESEFRGRMELRERPAEPGSMGVLTDILDVALGSGGAVSVLVGAIVVWLKGRKGSVTIKITRNGNTAEVSATRVRDLDPAALRALTEQISAELDRKPEQDDPAQPESGDNGV